MVVCFFFCNDAIIYTLDTNTDYMCLARLCANIVSSYAYVCMFMPFYTSEYVCLYSNEYVYVYACIVVNMCINVNLYVK